MDTKAGLFIDVGEAMTDIKSLEFQINIEAGRKRKFHILIISLHPDHACVFFLFLCNPNCTIWKIQSPTDESWDLAVAN
jgi:hypothetical protein